MITTSHLKDMLELLETLKAERRQVDDEIQSVEHTVTVMRRRLGPGGSGGAEGSPRGDRAGKRQAANAEMVRSDGRPKVVEIVKSILEGSDGVTANELHVLYSEHLAANHMKPSKFSSFRTQLYDFVAQGHLAKRSTDAGIVFALPQVRRAVSGPGAKELFMQE